MSRIRKLQGVVLWHGFCELFWCVASGFGLGLVLGLGQARRMLGLLRDESPSVWVLVHWCGLAAVARMPAAVVGSRCVIPWGGAKRVMVLGSVFGRICVRRWGEARPLPRKWWMCNHRMGEARPLPWIGWACSHGRACGHRWGEVCPFPRK